jgi:hypothetical protein
MTSEQEIVGRVKSGFTKTHSHKFLLNEEGKWFLLIEKHAPFRAFGKIFMDDESIIGESLNRESLLDAVSKKATLLFIYARHIYEIPAVEFFEWSFKNNTYRKQYAGEYTYSVPMTIMKAHSRSFR